MNYWTEIWMNFAHHIKNDYCSFKGGETRRDYWTFVLSILICSIGVKIVDALIGRDIFSTLFSIFIFLPLLGAQVRRLHDRGVSVWFLISKYIALSLGLFFPLFININFFPLTDFFDGIATLFIDSIHFIGETLDGFFYKSLNLYFGLLSIIGGSFIFKMMLLFLSISFILDIIILVFTIQKGKGEYKNIVYKTKDIDYEVKNEATDSSNETKNDK